VLNEQQLTTVILTFTLALMHTLLPSHWLCFVLVGRAHRWTLRKTQFVAMGAGGAHVLLTAILGAGIVQLDYKRFHEWAEFIAAGVLAALGLLYIVLHFVHAGHHHERDVQMGDRVGIASLYATVTISPCSLIIPVLFGAAGFSLEMFVFVILVLLATTLGAMAVLIAIAYQGMERLKLTFLDRFEKLIIGGVLIAVAGSMILFHLGHDHGSDHDHDHGPGAPHEHRDGK
jgi:putative Mn2+ efflux pump MntP